LIQRSPPRASANGVGIRTQRYLDALARDRPDLLRVWKWCCDQARRINLPEA
jgi:hypothetical protein